MQAWRAVWAGRLAILITSAHPQTRPSDPASHTTPCRDLPPHLLLGPDSRYPAGIFPCPGTTPTPPEGRYPGNLRQPLSGEVRISLLSWILGKEKGGAARVERVLGARNQILSSKDGVSLAGLFTNVFVRG